MIDAVESDDYTNGVNVEFSYPKNFNNLKSDGQMQLIEDFYKTQEKYHTPEMTGVIEMNDLIDSSTIPPPINNEENNSFDSEVNLKFNLRTGVNLDESI